MPPKFLAEYAPPAGGPVYQIWQGDKLDVIANSIVVVTDKNHTIDRQQFKTSGRMKAWYTRTGGNGGLTQIYNDVVHSDVVGTGLSDSMQPARGKAVDTTGR